MTLRIGIAGLATESSSFTEHRTQLTDFEVLRDEEILDLYGYRSDDDVRWVPLLRAVAPPGGPVEPSAYDALESELLTRLEQAVSAEPLDGLLLDIHGAMVVAGRDAAEERLLRRVRAVIGTETVVAVGMDPHGNLSPELVGLVDIATCHRHSPHIDHLATRDRAADLLVRSLRDGRRPAKAWARVPVLLSGERTSTLAPAGRRLFLDAVSTALASGEVWDAAIWVGRAWADEERCAAAVLAIGDDGEAAARIAQTLAREFWAARTSLRIVADHHGDWQEAIAHAEGSDALPVFVSDSGDNVTAGGSGDITFAIHATRRARAAGRVGRRWLFAGLVDAPSVAAAREAGEQAVIRRPIGAVVDRRFGGPVEDDWRVDRLFQSAGEVVGALLTSSSEAVIVQDSRSPFVGADDPAFSPGMLQRLVPFAPQAYDVVVVKNGYLFPTQTAAAGSAFLAITPGGSDLDFGRLDYQRRSRPMFPLDTDFTPALDVRVSAGTQLRTPG